MDALISAATAASPRLMSVPHPVAYTLYIQPSAACATTSTAAVSASSMTAGIPITASVTVRDSFGNLRTPNSYSASSNMDNVVAVMYALPTPLTPPSNFMNGFEPSGAPSSFTRSPWPNARGHSAVQERRRAADVLFVCFLPIHTSLSGMQRQTFTRVGSSTRPSQATTKLFPASLQSVGFLQRFMTATPPHSPSLLPCGPAHRSGWTSAPLVATLPPHY